MSLLDLTILSNLAAPTRDSRRSLPRRDRSSLRVKAPKDWPITKRLVWTLTVRGKTEKANAFLLPEWNELQVMALNGAGGGGGGVDGITTSLRSSRSPGP